MLEKYDRCDHKLYQYEDGDFLVKICWSCGHYESNSSAYRLHPDLYENMVRENPVYFMVKFCKSDESLHRDDNGHIRRQDDSTKHRKIY